MRKTIALFSLGILTMTPFLWRLAHTGGAEFVGLLSDIGVGALLFALLLYAPHWLRTLLALSWAAFSIGAHELVAAIRRLPNWADIQFLGDVGFVGNTMDGFNIASPAFVLVLLLSAAAVSLLPIPRPQRWRILPAGLAAGGALLLAQSQLSIAHDDQSVVARYNALHWLLADSFLSSPGLTPQEIAKYPLPKDLNTLNLDGRGLLAQQRRPRNVLVVALEGMSGLYYPRIRQAMNVPEHGVSMNRLAASTGNAMLIPDFVTHSHQTIRGLYSLLCGDFSKLSWDTPKAVELQWNPQRAQQCLPAQMAKRGWSTHFLQGAGLSFMGKDWIMPLIGFEQVHGKEWFKEENPYAFGWGTVDSVFFRGAREYIADIRSEGGPWMLTLLTVGTHQPYAVPDEIADQYPSRMAAAIDLADQAVAKFIEGLRQDGVLENTLVLITSDEAHGTEEAEWAGSWGLGVVLAPEAQQLPRIKQGTFGLVDVEASVLDYLGQPIPPAVIGRSFFRDYAQPRDMVSFTSSKRRWHTADNLRYECVEEGRCRVGKAKSLLGPPPKAFERDSKRLGEAIFPIAAALDSKLIAPSALRVLRFASGEIRRLPEKIGDEWGDSLVGAQNLNFPAHSKVDVSIKVKVLEAPREGVQLRLALKQWEHALDDISHEGFPLLHAQDEARLQFSFLNSVPRQAFSFFLLGEGKDATVQLEEFNITVDTQES